jgi:hypothetical protein
MRFRSTVCFHLLADPNGVDERMALIDPDLKAAQRHRDAVDRCGFHRTRWLMITPQKHGRSCQSSSRLGRIAACLPMRPAWCAGPFERALSWLNQQHW